MVKFRSAVPWVPFVSLAILLDMAFMGASLAVLIESVRGWNLVRLSVHVTRLQLIIKIGAMVMYMLWFWRLYDNVRAFGRVPRAGKLQYVLNFLMPIVNFYQPYKMMAEVWNKVGKRRAEPVPTLFKLWWATWLFSWLILPTLNALKFHFLLTRTALVAKAVGHWVAGALAIAVICRVTERQETRLKVDGKTVREELVDVPETTAVDVIRGEANQGYRDTADTRLDVVVMPRTRWLRALFGSGTLLASYIGTCWLFVATAKLNPQLFVQPVALASICLFGGVVAFGRKRWRPQRVVLSSLHWATESGKLPRAKRDRVRPRRDQGQAFGLLKSYSLWLRRHDGSESPLFRGLSRAEAGTVYRTLRQHLRGGALGG